ncbi:MAG TPA: cupin domain-containing protein [Ktedonobacteraceae bacterium]|nr:cupin domain-containing protein [Ktedonobacteraceae bacterium]
MNEKKEGTESSLKVFDVPGIAQFPEEGPFVQVLSDTGYARVVLFGFKAGQQLREHHTSSPILVQAVRGKIVFTAAGKQVEMRDGMLVTVEAQVRHSLVAETDAVVLVTMTPSPSFHSLQKELFKE